MPKYPQLPRSVQGWDYENQYLHSVETVTRTVVTVKHFVSWNGLGEWPLITLLAWIGGGLWCGETQIGRKNIK